MSLRALLVALYVSVLTVPLATAAEPPKRLVSAGGAVTEWIVELGAQASLVGVDTTSQNPESLKPLPRIGYQRQLSAEGILSLRPDAMAGADEMGPPAVLEQLRAAGVRIEVLPAQPELDVLKDNLQRLGDLLGVPERAAQLSKDFAGQLAAQQQWLSEARSRQAAPGVLLLVGHGGGKPMVAGTGTVGDWLIKQAGGRNLATHDGYKVVSSEAMAALNAQVLIVADRTLTGEAARQALLKENPLLAVMPAVRDKRVIDLDPTLLVGGLGPRLPGALLGVSKVFYPQP